MDFTSQRDFEHGRIPKVGVLVANLGTPDAPDTPSLKRYLRQFLSDPRVIELPQWKWKPILNLIILNTRPAKSAEAYREVWTDEGSPLLLYTRAQAAGIAEILDREVGTPTAVEVAMTYGEPSVATALRNLRDQDCRRILVLPMYPQYSGTTTASVYDAVFRELQDWRWVPEIRTIGGYHDRPGYIRALAASIRETWQAGGEPEHLLFSFHGIPLRYFKNGDPYHCFCHATARLVATELGLPDERWTTSFQSLFGREEWLKPYTDKTIQAMAASGVKSLDVVCPGFSSDCLETIEEIDQENREYFEEGGGERFRYIPALNDRPDHLRFLGDLVQEHLQGWVAPPAEWSRAEAEDEAAGHRRRAESMSERGVSTTAGFGES
jgi:ferrochelatase